MNGRYGMTSVRYRLRALGSFGLRCGVAAMLSIFSMLPVARAQQDPLTIHPPETVWQADGISAQIARLSRPGVRHSGRLLIAFLDPARFEADVTDRLPVFGEAGTAGWQLTVDGGFFDENERPLYLLQEGTRVHAPFRSGTSAVFWCRDGTCRITHAQDYDPYQPVDIAVQSSPRVFANGAPTVGVRNRNTMASRAGLAITRSGQLAVFATDRWPWQGLTFDEVATMVAPLIDATDILMLDGGSSVVFELDAPGFSLFARGSGRSVPYMISFFGTG